MIVWQFIVMGFGFPGIPSDDTYTFKWDNPFFRGSSTEDDDEMEPVSVFVPRPLRVIPEMEYPRDLVDRLWDSRRLPFDESLGSPSPFKKSSGAPAASGFKHAKGDSLDFVSDKPFRGKGTYDTLGVEGGGGGRYGTVELISPRPPGAGR